MTQAPNDDRDDRLADLNASPFNPLPWPVWVAILAIAGVEAALWLGGQGLLGGPEAIGWRLDAIQRLGFSAAVQQWMLETRQFPIWQLVRHAAFWAIHAGPLHALFVIILLAALGKYIGEPFGNVALATLMVVPPLAGATVFGLVMADRAEGWLFGGMPTVFGLVGALTWWRWQSAADRAAQLRAFGLIGALLLARLGFGLLAEAGHAWIAEIAAFAAGFALSAVIGPGAWRQLRERLRAR